MIRFFCCFLAIFRLLLLALWTILTVLIALPIFYLSGQAYRVSYMTAKTWGRIALLLLNIRVNILGQRPKGQVLIMPNHQTFIDIFLILGYSPASIVAKKEIGSWPVLRHAVKLGRIILVDRNTLRSMLETMHSIKHEIDSGGSVILFPEGRTNAGPLTQDFRSGSFKIAEETDVPIIPVAIKYLNADMAWRDESFFALFLKVMGHWRVNVDMWYGEPVFGLPCKEMMAKTKALIDAKLEAYL